MRNVPSRLGFHLILALLLAGCASPLSGLRASFEKLESSRALQPARYPEGDWSPAGFEFEDAWFKTADGTRLNGWYCHHEKPAAVVLVAHGQTGNLSECASVLRTLRDRNHVAALAFDYRGFGKSDGEADEHTLVDDARAARNWLARRANVREHDIVLVGHSLGGAVLIDLAAAECARGLVLIDTITSLGDLASRSFSLMPAGLVQRERLEAIPKIGRYHGALLQIHGSSDVSVDLQQAQKLFAAANEPKQFVARHTWVGREIIAAEDRPVLEHFLASLPPPTPLPLPPRWHKTGAN